MADGFSKAMTSRSLRTIKTELEFLMDADVITSQQFDSIINTLPISASTRAPGLPARHQTPVQTQSPVSVPPVQQLSQMSLRQESQPSDPEKSNIGYYGNNAASNLPPPAYPTPPVAPTGPPALAYASAIYQYNAQDAGDLALMPNDKVVVTEYMNNEWWKGRNERTGQEGIFPASYVRREEKAMPLAPQPSNYGNMPLDVSNGAASGPPAGPQQPGKGEEMGKKFGKKLGNAAIFGAGATIGGKIVNGIF
ncbi:SH3-domain-containing protein [Amniculicola lignicola CBS 123094]|uniref:SH3-domain-containing protein n=1 Tax=Amniculicola lignicola CBS 123094 TaxID=1392246 RepID=A0A6A5WP31_9PLEO|nr:SH3-domain-containing protein [Amniculicola lignicola CBS 123094]